MADTGTVRTKAELVTQLFALLEEGLSQDSKNFLEDVRATYNSFEVEETGKGDKLLYDLVSIKTKTISMSK